MLRVRLAILSVILSVTWSAGSTAAEINKRQHLDPRLNSKVQNHIAKGWSQKSEGQGGAGGGGAQAGCGGQAVGNVQVGKGAQGPREVNTIVTGDVINVVRPGACR